MLRTLESNFNGNTAVFKRGTRRHRVSLVHDNTSVHANQVYQEYMSEVKAAAEKEAARIKAAAEAEAARIAQERRITEEAARIKAAAEAEAARIAEEMRITEEAAKVKAGTKPVTKTKYSKFKVWVSGYWNGSYLETKYSKFKVWYRTDKPMTTNNSLYTWALGKYLDFFPFFHSLLRVMGYGYLADAMSYFNILMMRPEPSVNSWYWDKVGTLILISCLGLVIYVCWKIFLKPKQSQQHYHAQLRHELLEAISLCKSNLLQQTQQYYAQPQQSQQYYAQLHQELLEAEYFISQGRFAPGVQVLQHPVSHQLNSPLPSMPYFYAPYCNNIPPCNLYAGQFSTPPRSERRLYLNEQKLDYSAKKML